MILASTEAKLVRVLPLCFVATAVMWRDAHDDGAGGVKQNNKLVVRKAQGL
jgi:hypothetical protein